MSTPHHANLFAHELTLRRAASNVENLIPTLMRAREDLPLRQIFRWMRSTERGLFHGIAKAAPGITRGYFYVINKQGYH